MKSIVWRREDAISRLRRDIWRYLTQAARTDEDVVLHAARLLQMPASQVRILAQLQFILGEPVGRLLEQMPLLVRRLMTTTADETEISAERIRGTIRWGETFGYRAATGAPHVFVTGPSRRAYDTPENEVLVFALDCIATFGKRTGWHQSTTPGPAEVIRSRVADATRWLQYRALEGIPANPPTPKTLTRVRTGRSRRRYQAALDVVLLYQRFLARLDRAAVREAVEQYALIARRDSVLLELECAFQTIRALRRFGWEAPPQGLLRPPILFQGRRDDAVVRVYYQQAPNRLAAGSRYSSVQRAHRFGTASGLVPDVVVEESGPLGRRWILIEVKGLERTVEESARAALFDLLAYRRAYSGALGDQQRIYGIGYAWGAELVPNSSSEILLSTPDTFELALASQFGREASTARPS